MFRLSLPASPRSSQDVFSPSSSSQIVSTENLPIAPWLNKIIEKIDTKISELVKSAKNIEIALGIIEGDEKETKLTSGKSIMTYSEWYSHNKFLEFVSDESISHATITVRTAINDLVKLRSKHIAEYKSHQDRLKRGEEKLKHEKQSLIKELMLEPKKQLAKMIGSPSKMGVSTWPMHGTPTFIEAVKAKINNSVIQPSRPKGEEAKKFQQVEDFLQIIQGIARLNIPKQNSNNKSAMHILELSLSLEELDEKSFEDLKKISEQIKSDLLLQRAKILIDNDIKNKNIAKELENGDFKQLKDDYDFTTESYNFVLAKNKAAELLDKISEIKEKKQSESKNSFSKISKEIEILNDKILQDQKRLDTAIGKFLNAYTNTAYEVNYFDELDEICANIQGEFKVNDSKITDIEIDFNTQKDKFFNEDNITGSVAGNTLKNLQEVAKHNNKLKDTVAEIEKIIIRDREAMKKTHALRLQKEMFLMLKSAVTYNNYFWGKQVSRFNSRYYTNTASSLAPKGISKIYCDFRDSPDSKVITSDEIMDVINKHKMIIEDRLNSWQHFFGLRKGKTDEFYVLVRDLDISIPANDPVETMKDRREALKQRLQALGLTIETDFNMVPINSVALKA